MKRIKLLFLDVDGTLTDGKLYIGCNGELFKAFDVKDGCGIHDILPKYKIVPVVITARTSEIVKIRCGELNIEHCYQGCRDKLHKMMEVAAHFDISLNQNGILENVAYMGDDILDLPCMEKAEIRGCPADAVAEVKEICDFVSENRGGNGAVRDFIKWLIYEEDK